MKQSFILDKISLLCYKNYLFKLNLYSTKATTGGVTLAENSFDNDQFYSRQLSGEAFVCL